MCVELQDVIMSHFEQNTLYQPVPLPIVTSLLAFEPFKAKDLLYISPTFAFSNSAICLQCIYVFCLDLKTAIISVYSF